MMGSKMFHSAILRLTDKKQIEDFLRKNTPLHLYGIGDLDDFFWPYVEWYATRNGTDISCIFFLYTAANPPTLIALEEYDTLAGQQLLRDLLPRLPERFDCHISPGLLPILQQAGCRIDAKVDHLKMRLHDMVKSHDTCQTSFRIRRLTNTDLPDLLEFYQRSYPGNWFDPRMLKTDRYFGAFIFEKLLSAAGVHVYSSEYKVAALGNITTDPDYRGQGVASRLTLALCQDLRQDGIKDIGLNVKTDNLAAIRCYEKIGFAICARYAELSVTKS